MNNTVLVTGAGGFIGSRVINALSNTNNVIAGVRNARAKRSSGIRYEECEINGKTQWDEKLKGVDTIVHLAAVAHGNSSDSDYIDEVNVKGTDNLARQAVKSGVKRFVFISSIGVLGNLTLKPFDEKASPKPHSRYAESKLKAEQILLQVSSEEGLEVVIIRPVLVYGVGAPGNFGKLVRLVQKTPFLPFALCENKRSYLSVDNLVDFIETCIHHPKAANETFCISDGHDVSIREFTDGIAKGLNKNLRQLPFPVFMFKLIGKITGKSDQIDQLIGNLQVDSGKARDLLSWIAPVTMKESLRKLGHFK